MFDKEVLGHYPLVFRMACAFHFFDSAWLDVIFHTALWVVYLSYIVYSAVCTVFILLFHRCFTHLVTFSTCFCCFCTSEQLLTCLSHFCTWEFLLTCLSCFFTWGCLLQQSYYVSSTVSLSHLQAEKYVADIYNEHSVMRPFKATR